MRRIGRSSWPTLPPCLPAPVASIRESLLRAIGFFRGKGGGPARQIRLGQPQQYRSDRGGQRLDKQDPAVDSCRAIHAGDDDAGQEECENRATPEAPVLDEAPQQAGGQEAVVKALIGR